MLKRFLPTTLFGRALAITITPVVLLQVVSTYIFYERHWDNVTRRLAQGLAGDIAMIVDLRRNAPDGALSQPLKNRIISAIRKCFMKMLPTAFWIVCWIRP